MAETEWVLVPKRPTQAMWNAWYGEAEITREGSVRRHEEAWQAMLSASPKPPHQEEGALEIAGYAYRDEWRGDRPWSLTQMRPAETRHRIIEPLVLRSAVEALLLSQASQIEALRKERDDYRAALEKIDAIRDSIIGFQTVGWSDHIYPLVAALKDAGFSGKGYDAMRTEIRTMLAAETKLAEVIKEKGKLHDYANMRDVQLVDTISLLRRLQHWIEDEVGAEMPFGQSEAEKFAALVPNSAFLDANGGGNVG